MTGAAARAAIPGTAGLAAVNGAIERMGITLAKELTPLRVNVLSPGLVDTSAYDWMPPDQKQGMLRDAAAKLPAQRYGRIEDIAEAMAIKFERDENVPTLYEFIVVFRS